MTSHEKQCKSCGLTFTGFTPVCKECNAKKGEEIASAKGKSAESVDKTRNHSAAQNSVQRRPQQRTDGHDTENSQQRTFFNNKNYNGNRRGGYQDGTQNHYSSENVFGGGYRKKKEQGSNVNYEHQNNGTTFSRVGGNNNRSQPGGFQSSGTQAQKNYDREDRSDYQDAPKAFDFRNNRSRGERHTPFQQNTQNQEEVQEQNPFTHLKKVCERFKEGKCSYGDRCRFSHSETISKPDKPKGKQASQDFSKDGFGQRL